MQKRRYQNKIKSKASQSHSSFLTLIFHLSHCSSLTVRVCGILFMAEAPGRAAPEEKMPGLPGLCISVCLMPKPAKSPTSGFHCTLPA